MKRGKKYQEAVKAYDKQNLYDVDEAIEIVKKNATAKFDASARIWTGWTGCGLGGWTPGSCAQTTRNVWWILRLSSTAIIWRGIWQRQ